jgi:hypothetical protein
VAERSIARGCKPRALWATGVRIPPHAKLKSKILLSPHIKIFRSADGCQKFLYQKIRFSTTRQKRALFIMFYAAHCHYAEILTNCYACGCCIIAYIGVVL